MTRNEREALSWLLRELGVNIPWHCGRPRKFTPAQEQAILDERKSGDSYSVIALRVGINRVAVWRAATAARLRNRSVARGTSNTTPTIQKATL